MLALPIERTSVARSPHRRAASPDRRSAAGTLACVDDYWLAKCEDPGKNHDAK
jgi:hypothetical protein